jgi:hypothetical protein
MEWYASDTSRVVMDGETPDKSAAGLRARPFRESRTSPHAFCASVDLGLRAARRSIHYKHSPGHFEVARRD